MTRSQTVARESPHREEADGRAAKQEASSSLANEVAEAGAQNAAAYGMGKALQRLGLKTVTASTLLEEATLAGGRSAARRVAGQVAGATLRTQAVSQAAVLLVEGGVDGYRYARGRIDGPELRWRVLRSAAGAAGGASAAAAGAWVGTLALPGLGTAVGGAVGSILGTQGARSGFEKARGEEG